METETYKDFTINIYYDDDAMHPREWDNLSTIVTCHSRYNIGDISANNREQYFKELYDLAGCDFDVYDAYEDYEERIVSELEKVAVVLPLYMYDHSGITINTTGFSCGWDSGQVGVVVVLKEHIYKECDCKRISKKLRQKVIDIMVAEVKTYDDYIAGSVYGFSIESSGGDILDGCRGFYGHNHEKSGLLCEAKRYIEHIIA